MADQKFDPDIFLPKASSLVPKTETIPTGTRYQKIHMDRPGSIRALSPSTVGTIYVYPVSAPSSDAQAIPYPDGSANLPGVGEWWVRHTSASSETFQIVYDGPPGSTASPTSPTSSAPVPNRGTGFTANKTVAVPSTPEQCASQAVPDGFAVVVKALPTNTGNVGVGFSAAAADLATGTPFYLEPGASVRYYIRNTDLLWIDAIVAANGVCLTSEV